MKLLIYARDWLPSVGGVEFITKALADGFAERSKSHPADPVDVTLFTQTPAGKTDDSLFPYRVIRKPSLAEWIRQIRSADIVQLMGPSLMPLMLVWMLRTRVVLQHQGYQSVCPNGLLLYEPDRSVCPGHFMARHYQKCIRCNKAERGWIGSFLSVLLTFPRRWLARRATVNVGASSHVAQRVNLPRTQVIWNGVPVSPQPAFDSSTLKNSQPVRFAFFGRLVVEKGVAVLLQACRELSNEGFAFRLKIIGDGPERRRLESITEELGLGAQTEFTGFASGTGIAEAMQGVSAVVMPSICEDVSPLAAMEQLMEGRLLIASDIGGLGQIVDGVGLKFPAGDVAALASCMREVLQNPSRAMALGQQARQRALQTFTKDRMVEEHARLYYQLLRS
jgi:glycosyltransferase involved in cell wall biosynthesis